MPCTIQLKLVIMKLFGNGIFWRKSSFDKCFIMINSTSSACKWWGLWESIFSTWFYFMRSLLPTARYGRFIFWWTSAVRNHMPWWIWFQSLSNAFYRKLHCIMISVSLLLQIRSQMGIIRDVFVAVPGFLEEGYQVKSCICKSASPTF